MTRSMMMTTGAVAALFLAACIPLELTSQQGPGQKTPPSSGAPQNLPQPPTADNDGDNGGEPSGPTTPQTSDGTCPSDTFIDVSQTAGAGGSYAAPSLDVSCTDDTMIVNSNGIPHYEFNQMTPTDLSTQSYSWEIPLSPTLADVPSGIPLLGSVGIAVNGLPFYGPNEAANLGWGDPVADAILDWCLGHTGPTGDYHFHALSQDCFWDIEPGEVSPIIGYAFDGFPIYGPVGCLDAECTQVVEFQSSWDETGTSEAAWDNHVYTEKSGDEYLDECNGRVGPDGTYRYHATSTFPYIIGCYAGDVNASQTGTGDGGGEGGGPGGGGPGGGGPGGGGGPPGPPPGN